MKSKPPNVGRPLWAITLLSLTTGCASGFKDAVVKWADGPSYSAPAKELANDPELDATSKRIELMGYSGLACTIDEDSGASKPDEMSSACKCARPTDPMAALADCVVWANAL